MSEKCGYYSKPSGPVKFESFDIFHHPDERRDMSWRTDTLLTTRLDNFHCQLDDFTSRCEPDYTIWHTARWLALPVIVAAIWTGAILCVIWLLTLWR